MSWGRLGRLLGASWRLLGASWGHLGDVLGRLGRFSKNIDFPLVFKMFLAARGVSKLASWRRLGAVWRVFWGHLGASWVCLGPSLRILSGFLKILIFQ